MSTMRSQDEIRNTVVSLGLPEHPYFMRRAARAMDLLDTGKVNFVGDEIFRVHSQFDDTIYHVELNHGTPGCTCADHQKNPGVLCKHMIAATIYSKQAKSTVKVTWDDTENSYHKRGRWWVTDYKRKVKYIVYRDGDGKLICPCGRKPDCEHRKAIREYLNNNGGGNGSKIKNECGSNEAKALQDQMNGQLDSQNNNGNGAKAPSQPQQLDLSDPFQESEQNDIDQIEGRKNGELAWKLSNGEYVISYKGIMKLAEKHGITFTDGYNSNTAQVIARAKARHGERISGKLPIPSKETAIELAKRNAARQLLSLAEIKAIEHKVKLNAEFNWQKAYDKCAKLVGGKAQLDCIIFDLVNSGNIRQDNPSHYDRTEWLVIHNACKEDASNDNNDGGDKTPPSQPDENWREWYNKCVEVSSLHDTSVVINQMTPKHYYRKDRITDDEWERIFSECKRRREEYERTQAAKADFASAQQAYKFKHIRDVSGYDVKAKKYVGRPPLNSKEFIAKCQEAIAQVRESNKQVEANEQPLEGNNHKRKIQMDKKLRTWLIETDGTKKEISCREICETFESKQNPSIVTRLRAGIDDGADISVVELN